MSIVDEISPRYYGEDRIKLTLHSDTSSPQVFQPVIVLVDYSECDPEGVVLPLEFTLTGQSGPSTASRRVFRKVRPTEITFRPVEGGSTLVRVAELYHNRWWGSLVIDVAGDPLAVR
jgi:hypothetical protein